MHLQFTTKDVEHFWAKVDKSGECWLWTGTRFTKGYGRFQIKDKSMRTHRISYLMTFGSIPDGLCVCHHCDSPACVNPAHLFIGTQRDNMLDSRSKGRAIYATGERHGTHTHPESVAIGKRHGMHTHPESTPRGERNGNAILTEQQVLAIRRRYAPGEGARVLAREYGVHLSTIWAIIYHRNWQHLP